MKPASGLLALAFHLAIVSSISFVGFPTVLPDVRKFVGTMHGWITDQDFTNIFAMAQAIPGPNMILMMGTHRMEGVGASRRACCFHRDLRATLRDLFYCISPDASLQEAHWQRVLRSALVPVTTGLITASGIVMAQGAGITWAAIAVTGAAAIVMLTKRLNPLWLLAAGGVLGGLGFLV
jgi:chromate transporter